MKNKLEFMSVVLLSILSLVAGSMIFNKGNVEFSFAVYNMIRAVIFSLICFYLVLKPSKVNFMGKPESNVMISRGLAQFFSLVNVVMSVAFYLD